MEKLVLMRTEGKKWEVVSEVSQAPIGDHRYMGWEQPMIRTHSSMNSSSMSTTLQKGKATLTSVSLTPSPDRLDIYIPIFQ